VNNDKKLMHVTWFLPPQIFGFDYLRDQLVHFTDQRVLSGLDVAIVDEADSILVDEARISLVISGDIHQSNDHLTKIAKVIKQLDKENDYATDELSTSVQLNESRIDQSI
jgi:preprotein translocase subunit SecA